MNKQKSLLGSSLSRVEAMHLQAIEGNPLTEDEVAMFEMFDRENWTTEERIEHIGTQSIPDRGVSKIT